MQSFPRPVIYIPILVQSPHFVVLDKPAGLPVHTGRRGGPSVEDLFPRLSRRDAGPWLAHRLDADTSGCLVIALRRKPLLAAQAEFAAGRAEKIYWAVVEGAPPSASGVVQLPLIKRSGPGGWQMAVDRIGQSAATEWLVRGSSSGKTWLELRPRTGRTHQVRVHCAAIGCPILGDPVYGRGQGPLHLLARGITLRLAPILEAQAAPPMHMHVALRECGWHPEPT